MCAYLNFQLATSDGCNCIFRRMMVGGGRKRKLADYDPYEGAFSDDSEYEVSLSLVHLVPLTWCI